MVSASHQFCLGLFVPLPDNPQSIFLEYWCALALFPLAAVTLALQGAMFPVGNIRGLTGRHVVIEEAGFLARNIHPARWFPVIPAVHQGQESSELQTASQVALPLSCSF